MGVSMSAVDLSKRINQLGGFCLALAALFSFWLIRWAGFVLNDELFSYALIVPAISFWLVWQDRARVDWQFTPARGVAVALALLGLVLLSGNWLIVGAEQAVLRIALQTLAFVALVNAGVVWFLGGAVMRQLLFPAGFLVFMAPLPPGLVQGIEAGLQHASAEASAWLFALTGAAFFRSDLVFQLPGITIEVAPECSGIRSTLVLFLTSLIAGHLFLERGWQRWLFVLLVIPLGIARNALRIVTIGWLCIEYGPHMIDSIIHRRGGPFFFAVSLVPLFVLLYLFRRMNRSGANRPAAGTLEPASTVGVGSP